MAKDVRGKRIKQIGWRGTCPICKRTGVKLLWPITDADGTKRNVCKICGKK